MADALAAWVDQMLGGHTLVDPLPVCPRKNTKGQRVRRVLDQHGRSWVLKEVASREEWRAEVFAYEHWLAPLAGHTPSFLAADEETRALLMSEVPGREPRATLPRVNRKAGRVLRRLHDIEPPRPQPESDRDRAADRPERLLAESSDALTRQERAFVLSRARELAELPPLSTVPCHGDYRAHNWLLDSSGSLRMIDFGKSRREVAALDLSRLFFRPWWQRPRLADAFLAGYGRQLLPEEAQYIENRMAIDAVARIAFGVTRRSDRHVTLGRSRLEDLVAGHQVVPTRLCSS